MRGDQSLQGLVRFITSGQWRQRYDNLFRFLSQLIPALPIKSAPNTLEVWNMDHAGALMGLLNEGFVRASCSALQATMVDCGADVVVDFWNPLAVMAARAQNLPVITVIQADAHPASQGFIWWKTPPAHLPTPVPLTSIGFWERKVKKKRQDSLTCYDEKKQRFITSRRMKCLTSSDYRNGKPKCQRPLPT